MNYIVGALSVFVFIHTLRYGIYEKGQNNNIGAIIIFALSIICLILPNVIIRITM